MEVEMDWDGDPETQAERFEHFGDQLPEHLEAAMDEIMQRIKAKAVRNVGVDSGRLQSDLAATEPVVEEAMAGVVTGKYGSGVEYALFHELDNPYLRTAIEETRDFLVERTKQAVEDAWEAAA